MELTFTTLYIVVACRYHYNFRSPGNNTTNMYLHSTDKSNTGCLQKNVTYIFLYISVRINAKVLCIIWAEIGGPTIRFAYRNMSEG